MEERCGEVVYDEEDMLGDGAYDREEKDYPFGAPVGGYYYGTGMKPDDF